MVFDVPVELMGECTQMDDDQLIHINDILGVCPLLVKTHKLMLCRRPRHFWITWPVERSPDVVITAREHYAGVELIGDPPGVCSVLDKGWRTHGTFPGHFLTFTRALPEEHGGHKLRGIERTSAEEQAIWASERFQYAPYQYTLGNLVERKGEYRSLRADEREVIMGFPRGYTAKACAKAGHRC